MSNENRCHEWVSVFSQNIVDIHCWVLVFNDIWLVTKSIPIVIQSLIIIPIITAFDGSTIPDPIYCLTPSYLLRVVDEVVPEDGCISVNMRKMDPIDVVRYRIVVDSEVDTQYMDTDSVVRYRVSNYEIISG